MGRVITRAEALDIAQQYGLVEEVTYEIDHNFLDPWDALFEWDLLDETDFE